MKFFLSLISTTKTLTIHTNPPIALLLVNFITQKRNKKNKLKKSNKNSNNRIMIKSKPENYTDINGCNCLLTI